MPAAYLLGKIWQTNMDWSISSLIILQIEDHLRTEQFLASRITVTFTSNRTTDAVCHLVSQLFCWSLSQIFVVKISVSFPLFGEFGLQVARFSCCSVYILYAVHFFY